MVQFIDLASERDTSKVVEYLANKEYSADKTYIFTLSTKLDYFRIIQTFRLNNRNFALHWQRGIAILVVPRDN